MNKIQIYNKINSIQNSIDLAEYKIRESHQIIKNMNAELRLLNKQILKDIEITKDNRIIQNWPHRNK